MTEFEDLGDAEKVKFVEVELAATLTKLDDMIARLTALRNRGRGPRRLGASASIHSTISGRDAGIR